MAILTVKMIPQQNRVLKLIFFSPSPGGSSQPQPTVPVRRSRQRKWEPGILWSIHRGHTAAVPGKCPHMWMYIQYMLIYVCSKTFQKGYTDSLQNFEHWHRGT